MYYTNCKYNIFLANINPTIRTNDQIYDEDGMMFKKYAYLYMYMYAFDFKVIIHYEKLKKKKDKYALIFVYYIKHIITYVDSLLR